MAKIMINLSSDKIKVFKSKRDALEWIKRGMFGTDGAEREHYISMMYQLESGSRVLNYNN